ncbi:hypothetical protein [Moorena producens]|nr:hypothetical protein [Moorena producens]
MQSASGGNHASCSWGEPPQVGTGSPVPLLHRFHAHRYCTGVFNYDFF